MKKFLLVVALSLLTAACTSSTPGGILTESVRSRVTRLEPEHVGHGLSITWPRPWQPVQVRSSVKKPCA